ncbi:MAG TPA: CoA pyrophosphatase [Candidatus Dormibacteraeota bacterium]|nr:CoA pyrophosphatase [Candidatus Dormibacteraeota bacterium]
MAVPPVDRRRNALRGAIAAHLGRFERIASPTPLTLAAVAIVVLNERMNPCIPLLLRAPDLSRHAGQMALPGGKVNPGEHADDAALRELREELGLEASADGIVGALDDYETRSGFTITPVVVWSDARAVDLMPAHDEVAHVYLITLGELVRAVERAAPGTSESFCLGFNFGEVYAPTAAILYQFSEVALNGRSHRVNDFYQPPFTHR